MPKESDTMQFKLRLPKSLHRKMQRDADRHGQTLNAEILQKLQAEDASWEFYKRIDELKLSKLDKRIDELKQSFDEVVLILKSQKERP
jgi:Arc-like DNA binding dprotein